MRQFTWIEWNLWKIDTHALSADDVEASFDRVFTLEKRKDGSFQMFPETPSGRRIWVIWRLERTGDEVADAFGELSEAYIFVITAYRKSIRWLLLKLTRVALNEEPATNGSRQNPRGRHQCETTRTLACHHRRAGGDVSKLRSRGSLAEVRPCVWCSERA